MNKDIGSYKKEVINLIWKREQIDNRLREIAHSIDEDKSKGYKQVIREKFDLVI